MSTFSVYGYGKPTYGFFDDLLYRAHIPSTPTWYIAWGNGGTLVVGDLSNTKSSMNTEVTRSAATITRTNTTQTNDTLTLTVTFSPTGDQVGKTMNELGVYDAASGGNMRWWGFPWLEPDGLSGITIATGDTVAVTIEWNAKQESTSSGLTNVGMAALTALWGNVSSPAGMTYIAYGTGTTAESAALTTLTTEVARVAATFSKESVYGTNDTLKWTATHTAASGTVETPLTVTEIGVFDDPTTGIMLFRKLAASPRGFIIGQKVGMLAKATLKDGGVNFS